MTNAQNYTATGIATVKRWTQTVPVDTKVGSGVNYIVTRAEAHIVDMMRQVRSTGKCGIIVVRWDGQAWSFHACEPPTRMGD